MEEYDDPIEIELRTSREVLVFFYAAGIGATEMLAMGNIQGAQALSNLQIRLSNSDEMRVQEAIEEYGDMGIMFADGNMHEGMSATAAVSQMAEQDEVDPDETVQGGL